MVEFIYSFVCLSVCLWIKWERRPVSIAVGGKKFAEPGLRGQDTARFESNLFQCELGDPYVFTLRFLYVKRES